MFVPVLLLYDYDIVLADIETVKELKNVEDFQNFKVLKKIKSLTQIDDDLAMKFKKEISEGKELLNTVNNKLNDVNQDEVNKRVNNTKLFSPSFLFDKYNKSSYFRVKLKRIKFEPILNQTIRTRPDLDLN